MSDNDDNTKQRSRRKSVGKVFMIFDDSNFNLLLNDIKLYIGFQTLHLVGKILILNFLKMRGTRREIYSLNRMVSIFILI